MMGTHRTLLALLVTLSGNVALAQPSSEPLNLWYRQSARQRGEAGEICEDSFWAWFI